MFAKKKGGLEWAFVEHVRATEKLVEENFAIYSNRNAYKSKLELCNKTKQLEVSSCSLYNPLTYIQIIRHIKKVKPDIVAMHGNRAIDLMMSKLIMPFYPKNVKFMATTHNYRNKRFSNLDAVLAISSDLKKDLLRRNIPEEKIFLCPHSTKLQDRRVFTLCDSFTIGVLGRLHPIKGYDILIEALSVLKKEKITPKLLIAGDGGERSKLEQLVREKTLTSQVKFLGWIEDKKDLFDNIDVFCLPSRSEAFSFSLLEAFAFAKTVISTDCPGPMEIIDKYSAGILVRKEQPEELAEAIKTYIYNKELIKEHSDLAYKTIQDFYTNEKLLENLDKAIKYLQK